MKRNITLKLAASFVGIMLTASGCIHHGSTTQALEVRTNSPSIFGTQPAGEPEGIANIASKTTQLQDLRPGAPELLLRGVHAKSHGCVEAEFRVNPDLDEQYRVGLFRNAGERFDAQIRFSNAAVLITDDLSGGANGSRGMAIKVLDVDGPMLDSDQGDDNQDFLMVNTPEFAFQNVRAYGFLTDTLLTTPAGADPRPLLALADPRATTDLEGFSAADSAAVRQSLGVIQGKIQRQPVRNPAQVQYFGASPFLFGDGQAMKFSAAPCTVLPQAAFDGETPAPNYLRDALRQTMQDEVAICYNFQIQVRTLGEISIEEMENAATTWPDEEANYVDVARITIPSQQDIDSEQALESCEQLEFTPWHSLQAHQPIGGINRLRRDVYYNSALHRKDRD